MGVRLEEVGKQPICSSLVCCTILLVDGTNFINPYQLSNMLLVFLLQNGYQRIHLSKSPPSKSPAYLSKQIAKKLYRGDGWSRTNDPECVLQGSVAVQQER